MANKAYKVTKAIESLNLSKGQTVKLSDDSAKLYADSVELIEAVEQEAPKATPKKKTKSKETKVDAN